MLTMALWLFFAGIGIWSTLVVWDCIAGGIKAARYIHKELQRLERVMEQETQFYQEEFSGPLFSAGHLSPTGQKQKGQKKKGQKKKGQPAFCQLSPAYPMIQRRSAPPLCSTAGRKPAFALPAVALPQLILRKGLLPARA